MINIIEELSKIGFDWQVALANTINFLIVFFILKKFVFPPVKKMIEDRQRIINEGLDKAKAAETRLQEIDVIGKNTLKEAKQEASKIILAADKRAVDMDSELQKNIEKKRKEAADLIRADFQKQKEHAQHQVFEEAVMLVKKVIEKTVESDSDSIDEKLIKKAVAAVKESPYEKA